MAEGNNNNNNGVMRGRQNSRLEDDTSSIVGFTPPGNRQTWVGRLGNFSVQYNLGVASIAVQFMDSLRDHVVNKDSNGTNPWDGSGAQGDFPEPTWAKYTVLGMVFFGAVVGMLIMGNLGDIIGRRKAMLATLSLVVVGALGSGVLAWGSNDSVYGLLIACRFFVGMGVGGIYPLSAAHSSEHSEGDDEEDERDADEVRAETAAKVGWAFFWQIPGMCAPYVMALILLGIHSAAGDDFNVSAQWRLLYVVGAIPAALVAYLNYTSPESKAFLEAQKARAAEGSVNAQTFSPWKWAANHPKWTDLRFSLFGCSASWFLYDVAFYGTSIFSPSILKSIFGDDAPLVQISYQTLIVNAVGIPACILGVTILKKKGSFVLQLFGFLFMTFTFTLMGIVYTLAPENEKGDKKWTGALFTLFILINFSLQCAPSISTFVLPAMIFPTEVKTSFHGVAAACAKLGAVAGTFMFKPIKDSTSIQMVMFVQAIVSFLGFIVTFLCIPRTDEVIGQGEGAPLVGCKADEPKKDNDKEF